MNDPIVRREYDGHDGPNARGASHMVALALVLLNLEVVRRSTIKSMVPERRRFLKDGEREHRKQQGQKPASSGSSININKTRVNTAFRDFERRGWVERLGTSMVRVLDTESLTNWVTESVDVSTYQAIGMLSVAEAALNLRAEAVPAEPEAAEVRRQELLALKRLMESGPDDSLARQGRARIVPRSRPL